MPVKTSAPHERAHRLTRVKNGRFAPGNTGGPGRPARTTEDNYLQVTMQACPHEAWQRICERAVMDAINGDSRAREWLSRYLIGEPNGNQPKTDVPAVIYDVSFSL